MTVNDTTIRDTRCSGGGVAGHGARVDDKANLRMAASLLYGNRDAGILAEGGSILQVETVAVSMTQPNDNGERGWGLRARDRAIATVTGSLFDGNTEIGFAVRDLDTKMALSATMVRNGMSDEEGEPSRGMNVSEGASVAVSGCLFDGNMDAGIIAEDPGTKIDLSATVLQDTVPDDNGLFGIGALALASASMSIFNSLLVQNATAGVLSGGGASIGIGRSAVLNTQHGGAGTGNDSQVHGDGIVAGAGGRADVDSTIVESNGRNGIYFSEAPGSVVHSVITGNEFYGLAMKQCADQVEWEGMGNFILGNAKALPPDKAAQVTTSTGGMAVPPAPEMMAVPADPEK